MVDGDYDDEEMALERRAQELKTQFLALPLDEKLLVHRQEYVQECEHQDGSTYWAEFANVEMIDQDFKLYLKIVLDDDCSDDGEGCPGCGWMPGDGVNPVCNHSYGCGFWKELEKNDHESR